MTNSPCYIHTIFLYPVISCWVPRLISQFTIVIPPTINIGVQISVLYIDLHSFGCMPKSGMVELQSRSTFNVLSELHNDFHRNCISLHSHQQCMVVPFFCILTHICYCFLDDNHSGWGEIPSQCSLDLYFF
jgi:hypothetical protein